MKTVKVNKMNKTEAFAYLDEFEKQIFFDTLQRCKSANDWSSIAILGNRGKWTATNALKLVINQIPKNEKLYWLIVEIYVNNGYHFPRSIIIKAKKLKPTDYLRDLPEEFTGVDSITVYRCSATPPEKMESVRNEISWTTNIDVAEWFYNREVNLFNHPAFMYKATISKDKIVAYTNERNEFEVIQHGGVMALELVK